MKLVVKDSKESRQVAVLLLNTIKTNFENPSDEEIGQIISALINATAGFTILFTSRGAVELWQETLPEFLKEQLASAARFAEKEERKR